MPKKFEAYTKMCKCDHMPHMMNPKSVYIFLFILFYRNPRGSELKMKNIKSSIRSAI